MENNDKPIFGRKTFFLNPPLNIENFIMDSLKSDEYEVYSIPDYSIAKPLLGMNPDSILFVYIDDLLPLQTWFNFIKSFQKDEKVKNVRIGILSNKIKAEQKEKLNEELKLQAGIVSLDQKPQQLLKQINDTLDLNDAKGVRKVIRLDLKNCKDVNGYFAYSSLLHSFRLVDISSVGFAAVMPVNMTKFIKKDTRLENVSITMGRYSFVCTVKIYNLKIEGNVCTIVAIYDEKTSDMTKLKIHNFVFENLEDRNKQLMDTLPRDNRDYSKYVEEDEKEKDELNDKDVQEIDSQVEIFNPENHK